MTKISKIILTSFLYLLLSSSAFSWSVAIWGRTNFYASNANDFDLYVLNNTGEMLSADYSLPPDGVLLPEAASLQGIAINSGETKLIATAVNRHSSEHDNTWISLTLLKDKDVIYSGIFVKKLAEGRVCASSGYGDDCKWEKPRIVTLKNLTLPRLPYSISAGDNNPGDVRSDSRGSYTLVINK